MVGILKCYKTALPCTGGTELARFKTFPDCSVAEPREWCLFTLSWKGGDRLGPSWAVGLGLAKPTNCCFPAALPSGAHSNRFPPVSLILPSHYFTRTPNHTASLSVAHQHLEGLGLRETAKEVSVRPSAPPPPGGNRAPPRLARWPGTDLQVIQVYSGDLRVQEVFIGVELSDDVVHGRQPLVLIHRGYTMRP